YASFSYVLLRLNRRLQTDRARPALCGGQRRTAPWLRRWPPVGPMPAMRRSRGGRGSWHSASSP
ncbi:MAG: hypothetical protein MZV64_50570, partial [Ignavibacteriales bacterium]|nr:hypothetical protein [Ignavibacteriales bacterium]